MTPPRLQLIIGDAAAALRTLPDASIDACVSSPPAFCQRAYLDDNDPDQPKEIGHEADVAGYVSALVGVFGEVKRVLKPCGAMLVNLGETYYSGAGQSTVLDPRHPTRDWMRRRERAVDRKSGWDVPKKSQLLVPYRVALALQADGWCLRRAIVWDFGKSGPAEPSARDRPWRQHEPLFLFAKSPHGYTFDRAAMDGDEDVWRLPQRRATGPGNGGHGAAMPLALAERCVRTITRPGDVVLDPFLGTGTTAAACLGLGRGCVGVELSEKHAAFAVRRLEKLAADMAVVDAAVAA